jgi:hypothetical protein
MPPQCEAPHIETRVRQRHGERGRTAEVEGETIGAQAVAQQHGIARARRSVPGIARQCQPPPIRRGHEMHGLLTGFGPVPRLPEQGPQDRPLQQIHHAREKPSHHCSGLSQCRARTRMCLSEGSKQGMVPGWQTVRRCRQARGTPPLRAQPWRYTTSVTMARHLGSRSTHGALPGGDSVSRSETRCPLQWCGLMVPSRIAGLPPCPVPPVWRQGELGHAPQPGTSHGAA